MRQTKQSEKRGLKRSISLSSRSSSSSSSTISSATNPKNDPSGPIPPHSTPNPTPLRNSQATHAELKQTIRTVRRAPKGPILEILRFTHTIKPQHPPPTDSTESESPSCRALPIYSLPGTNTAKTNI